ncbi:hypothetical protein H8B09_05040 [Paenibacillus sp. PR3]|uniref:Uncharacterized protein n=1 Tax=Paenibacillus terricola TaxID=2763503 RepID=A0ABR8MQB2_9BACL|nr:hypothetical protein [Paenibacillus terricola]MBD3918108.1 hypothetical protein [Paenibacillus terricola]
MFELQDIIPYLFSISVLCSFAYVYLWWTGGTSHDRHPSVQMVLTLAEPSTPRVREWANLRHSLCRKVKRKEAPDDDTSNCSSSYEYIIAIIRGGFYTQWQTKQHSGYPFRVDTALLS